MPVKKSARVLKLEGAYKKNPNRENKREPETRALNYTDIPSELNNEEGLVFRRFMDCMPEGVYTVSDISVLTMAAKLQYESETIWEDFTVPRMTMLMKCLIQLGMTPVERSKLTVPKSKAKNIFDD